MPAFIFFLMRHAAIGFGLAGVFMALLLGLDIAGLRGLIVNSPNGLLAASILTFVLGLSFASVQMGMAVMSLDDSCNDTDTGGIPASRIGAVPAEVRVRTQSRRD